MAQLVIRFRRPSSMTESEMRAWILRRARGRHPVLARAALTGTESESLVLGVRGPADASEAAEERLLDLLLKDGAPVARLHGQGP